MKVILLSALILALFSCNSESKQDKPEPAAEKQAIASLKNEKEMDQRAADIDTLLSREGTAVSTLDYGKPDKGESYQAQAYTDAKGILVKVVEYFNDGNGKDSGMRTFYLNDGKPFCTLEEASAMQGNSFFNRISYYTPAGEVSMTKERRGSYEEEVAQMNYRPAALSKLSMDRAMRALNQQGEFATTFQGFVFQDAITYLVVGENKPDGYTSAIKCDFRDNLINTLSANEKKYIGKPLKVNFQEYIDQDGLKTQLYLGGSFAE